MAINVKFLSCTRERFESLTPVATSFYKVSNPDDTLDLYLGSVKLTNGQDLLDSLYASVIEYEPASGSTPAKSVKDALDELYEAIGGGGSVAELIKEAIEALDVTEFPIAENNSGVVTIHGLSEADGKIAVGSNSANDIVLARVATSGAAADVSVAGASGKIISTNVESAFSEIVDKINKKTEKEIVGSNGKALIFNEADGGGSKFEHTDGTWSYLGTNDGGKNGLTGQIYSIDHNNENLGTRLNISSSGFFYTTGKKNASYTAEDELATKGDVAEASGNADAKTVYMTSTHGEVSDNYSRRYSIYQGANGSSSSPVEAEKIGYIDVPRDMFVSDGTVVDITFDPVTEKLYDGLDDVTVLIKGEETPTAADAGKYIRLIIANAESSRLYISAKDLVDIYTPEVGASQIQLAIDGNNVISATVVAGSIGTRELADGGVTYAKLANDVISAFDEAGSAAAVQTALEESLTWQTI